MRRSRPLTPGPLLCLLILFASPALGQAVRPAAPAEPTTAPAGPATKGTTFSPLGDTSRFTKLGGWGGMGGMVGQFGLSRAMLINLPPVQEDLKLTDKQKVAVKEWSDNMRKQGEQAFRPPAPPAAGPDGAPGTVPPGRGPAGGGNTVPSVPYTGDDQSPANRGGPNGFNPFAMVDSISAMVREREEGLARILAKPQRKRLEQISLQMEGISSLARAEVAEAVNLSPGQSESIQEILGQTRTQQMGHFMGQALAARAARPTDPSRPPQSYDEAKTDAPKAPRPRTEADRPAKADPAKKTGDAPTPAADDPEAEVKRRQAAREKGQARFSKMMEGSDKIQDAATAKIAKILTRRQRERFEKILGEPFDPGKLNGPGGIAPPPPDRAATAPAADAKSKPETPAAPAPKSTRLRDARFKGATAPPASPDR